MCKNCRKLQNKTKINYKRSCYKQSYYFGIVILSSDFQGKVFYIASTTFLDISDTIHIQL